MRLPLENKLIAIVDDEPVFREILADYLVSLGAKVITASQGVEGLALFAEHEPELLICDLAMPQLGGLDLIEQLRTDGNDVPILVISATENMSEIAKALRLGVQDVLLKPVSDLNRLRETVYSCLYPMLFNSRVEEEQQLFQDWDALVQDPQAAFKLLHELQPPVQQVIADCRINYRQLISADKPGLILDIAPLSDHELAFYCLDVTRSGDNGVLAALLLRALFNGLIQEQVAQQHHQLPELGALLKKVNQLLRQANLTGQFPLLVGYYNRLNRCLVLISAGLNATLTTQEQNTSLSSGMPLGTLTSTYLNQITRNCDAWQCQIWGTGGRLRLMLSTE